MLQMLEREVVAIERHVVLLARHEAVTVQQRTIAFGDLPWTPWLIATRTDDGVTIGKDLYLTMLYDLIDTIVFSDRGERAPACLRSFLHMPEEARAVKLIGSPRHNAADIVDEIAKVCMGILLSDQTGPLGERPEAAAELRQNLDTAMRDFLRGAGTMSSICREVLDRRGLGRLALAPLLTEGPRLLDGLVHPASPFGRAARGESILSTPKGYESGVGERRSRIRRLLRRLGFRSDERWPGVLVSRRTREELAFIEARYQSARELLSGVERAASRAKAVSTRIPEALVQEWRNRCTQLLRASLERISSCDDCSGEVATAVLEEVTVYVRGQVEETFSEALCSWSIDSPTVTKFNDALAAGTLFRFIGRMNGGQAHDPLVVVSSIECGETVNVGSKPAHHGRIRLWKRQRPVLLAVTRPHAAELLAW
ncbi:MAG: hypothetical protein IPK72_23105 [Candidatus Eisenbacteria bacterium]|nr:hypothetical protein [Candidatus Eisenbacteria bacterium]